jgi:hypothetical protein
MIEQTKEEKIAVARRVRIEARKQILGYILGALGLVAGLAWNEAIKAFIDKFFQSESDTLTAKFLYAVIISIVVVIVSMLLLKFKGPEEEK